MITSNVPSLSLRDRFSHISDRTIDENWLRVAESDHHQSRDGVEKEAAFKEFEHCPEQCTATA